MKSFRCCAFVFFALFALAAGSAGAALPPAVLSAIAKFRPEGAAGWAYTQTSSDGNKTVVERFDPAQPEFKRWTLLTDDGQPPTEQEQYDYRARKYAPAGVKHLPPLAEQIEPATAERVEETPTHWVWRFRVKPRADGDPSAAHMRITLRIDKATDTIDTYEIATFEPFSPVLSVKIDQMRTVMTYSLPAGDRPSLLRAVTTIVSGRRMFLMSFDQHMTATYEDYAPPPLARVKSD